jgi:hypothetical protein
MSLSAAEVQWAHTLADQVRAYASSSPVLLASCNWEDPLGRIAAQLEKLAPSRSKRDAEAWVLAIRTRLTAAFQGGHHILAENFAFQTLMYLLHLEEPEARLSLSPYSTPGYKHQYQETEHLSRLVGMTVRPFTVGVTES